MPVPWPRLREIVDSHDRFLLTTHVRPDADAIGSELGLAGLLRQRGKEVTIVNHSNVPPRLRFLDQRGDVRQLGRDIAPGALDADVLAVLDTSAWQQLGDMAEVVRGSRALKVVIDHHVSQDDLGAEYFKDPSAPATGALVFEAAAFLDAQITPDVANVLFAALATDTGWFRFSNAGPETFRIAAELVTAGARPDLLYQALFERDTLGRTKLMGLTLARIEPACGGRVSHTYVLRSDFGATGAIPPDTEDLVNFTMMLAGVDVGLIFIEQPRGGVKVSFRSRGAIDCSRVAERFGGGGHRQAAGATLPDPIEQARERVLAAVAEALATTTV